MICLELYKLNSYHTFGFDEPICPKCMAVGKHNVIERGFEHNHRHDCKVCGNETWITNQ